MKAPTRGSRPAHSTAAAVPTKTGAIAAGRVRGRAAISQILMRRSGLRVLLAINRHLLSFASGDGGIASHRRRSQRIRS